MHIEAVNGMKMRSIKGNFIRLSLTGANLMDGYAIAFSAEIPEVLLVVVFQDIGRLSVISSLWYQSGHSMQKSFQQQLHGEAESKVGDYLSCDLGFLHCEYDALVFSWQGLASLFERDSCAKCSGVKNEGNQWKEVIYQVLKQCSPGVKSRRLVCDTTVFLMSSIRKTRWFLFYSQTRVGNEKDGNNRTVYA